MCLSDERGMSWDDTASTVVELPQSALHFLKSLQACCALCSASLSLLLALLLCFVADLPPDWDLTEGRKHARERTLRLIELGSPFS